MQRGFYSWFFHKATTHEQTNKTRNVAGKKNKTALSGANTETGTITHKTQHQTDYLNMVPNQRQ